MAFPKKGGTVCRKHGGAAPQVEAARIRRVALLEAHEEAERMLARAGVDADPIEHLVECLQRAGALVQVYGRMVADLDDLGTRTAEDERKVRGWAERRGVELDGGKVITVVDMDPLMVQTSDKTVQLHPFVREYHQALERWAKFAKLCLDAGVEERRIRAVEEHAEWIRDTFEAALDDAGISGEQRQAARKGFARHLRAVA